MTGRLSDAQRAHLARLADALIPGDDLMPAASGAHVATSGVDAVLTLRGDLESGLREALEVGGDDSALALAQLVDERPEVFGVLETVVSGAYFLNEEVCRLIGYPGQGPHTLIDEVPLYVELLARVAERGPLYRPTPGAELEGSP